MSAARPPGEGPVPPGEAPADAERTFFSGEGPAESELPPERLPPRRRALLARSPVVAMVALAACAFLVWDLSADTAYFFSPADPIDLGGPGGYHLDRARANRLVRVRGAPRAAVGATTGRGDARTVLGLAGTNLLVDRPGAGLGVDLFEGRLLPPRLAGEYAEAAAALAGRGFRPGDGWAVVRDGERPRQRWSRPLLALVALAVGAMNLRALLRRLAE
ncbi:MAG TPA: hypothetical protein VFP65_20570 [Anaeromyxobacteraceae bacterium]|nr:hypothetical protein [Anaeromyxobacteraceae bacterium]